MTDLTGRSEAYVACVPHVPILSLQEREVNPELWRAYEARIAELAAFDPDVVIVFGGDHYSNIRLNLSPTFIVGHAAEAINDCGGVPGKLDVPKELSTKLADFLVDNDFDIAVSYDMGVDHGFSNALGFFFHGKLDARPVIPVHINSLSDPRPSFRRCRQLGEAIGRWAASLGKRVAFIGSGGLSHQTSFIFPQFDTAPDEKVRDFIVHRGSPDGITDEKWHGDIDAGMKKLSAEIIAGEFKAPWINKEWDEHFLEVFTAGDLSRFDSWTDAEVLDKAGYGGGEIRMWIAAAAAGLAAGAPGLKTDFYSENTPLAIGAGIAHSELVAA